MTEQTSLPPTPLNWRDCKVRLRVAAVLGLTGCFSDVLTVAASALGPQPPFGASRNRLCRRGHPVPAERKHRRPQTNGIPIADARRTRHRTIVQPGAVLAAEILDRDTLVPDLYSHVPPRDRGGVEIGMVGAPDDVLAGMKGQAARIANEPGAY